MLKKKSEIKKPITRKRKTLSEKIRDHYLETVVNSKNTLELKKRMGVGQDCEIHINKSVNIKHEIDNET